MKRIFPSSSTTIVLFSVVAKRSRTFSAMSVCTPPKRAPCNRLHRLTVIDHALPPTKIGSPPRVGIRALPWCCQRIDEEHFDRVALVGWITAPVWIEIAARYKLKGFGT